MARILEGRNRATPDEAASFVDKFEQLENEKLKEKMSYMERCRRIVEQQKELLDDAKSQGVAKKIVKDIAKAREYERKSRELFDEYEADEKEQTIDIRKALGDFADSPLGAAAVAKEDDEQDETTSAIVDAVQNSMTDDEWDKASPKDDAA